jgi:hypothetical protein
MKPPASLWAYRFRETRDAGTLSIHDIVAVSIVNVKVTEAGQSLQKPAPGMRAIRSERCGVVLAHPIGNLATSWS